MQDLLRDSLQWPTLVLFPVPRYFGSSLRLRISLLCSLLFARGCRAEGVDGWPAGRHVPQQSGAVRCHRPGTGIIEFLCRLTHRERQSTGSCREVMNLSVLTPSLASHSVLPTGSIKYSFLPHLPPILCFYFPELFCFSF